ncbi:MAG: hypothetical protein A3E78_04950 [Alphaproteobacteria bacterium RIFCSPHIGHO2_12_FULL_63_12]|nr:MAG: hypothetical protein A3E78_04950 [Alphaproteobacteria bacterium RIFCSPHIGHO2_12_FULL_63_12]
MRRGAVIRLVAALALAAPLMVGEARAQVSGVVNWSTLGVADEGAIVSGTTQTSAGVTTTVTWSTVTDGGSFIAYAGNDFVSYEQDAQGGYTGYAQVGFDNVRLDPDDKVTVNLTFSEAISGLQFTLTDIDDSAWDDFVEVWYNTGSGFVNAKTGAFATLGPAVGADDESFGDGWEGTAAAASTSTDGNLAFNFGSLQITAVRIIYFSGDDAGNNGFDPGGQQLGISNVAFNKVMPLLSALKTVTMVGTSGTSSFAIPGSDVYYTMTVTNSGDGTVDTNTLFLSDPIPTDVEFYNADIDGAGPATGAVYFTQSGAGLSFTLATDVRYSSSAAKPASFAACTYTPSAGYDPNVRHLCLNPKGKMLAGNPDPSFSVQFRARIK